MGLAAGLALAGVGSAAAQSGPSGPSGPTSTSAPSTTATTIRAVTTTARVGGVMARTGGEWAVLPLAASGGAIAVVLGGRRLAARSARG